MSLPLHVEGPARMATLHAFVDFVEDWCVRAGVPREATLRLALVVEELFTNTVSHGHGGDCDAPVRLALRRDGAEIVLDYEDRAPAFDPLSTGRDAEARADARVGDRNVGGVGLQLIVGLAQQARYVRHGDRNHLRLRLGGGAAA